MMMSRKSEIEKAVKQFETEFGKESAEWFELGIHYVLGNLEIFQKGDRSPNDMTKEECIKANHELPEFFDYIPRIGIECSEEDSELPMYKIRNLLNYLTSINVDPYAD